MICGYISISQKRGRKRFKLLSPLISLHLPSQLRLLRRQQEETSHFWAPSTENLTWAVHLSHCARNTAMFTPKGRAAKSYRCLFRQTGGGKRNACPVFYRPSAPPFAQRQAVAQEHTPQGSRRWPGKLTEIPRLRSRIYYFSAGGEGRRGELRR